MKPEGNMRNLSFRSGREEGSMALTGRFDFRKTLTGRLILFVEEDVAPPFARFRKRSTRRRWRRARVMDLAATELRKLIDFRLKPQFQAPPSHVEQLSSSAQLSVGIEPANGDARVSAH